METELSNIVNEKDISTMSSKIVELLNPHSIYLFGSYAWGEPRIDSDIDLLVVVDNYNRTRTEYRMEIFKGLREYDTISIDLLIRTTEEFNKYIEVEGTLNHNIYKNGKLIYERAKN